jgi:hypothetical protein
VVETPAFTAGRRCDHRQVGAGDPFDEPVILLNTVVQIFHLKGLDQVIAARHLERAFGPFQAQQIAAAFVDCNSLWYSVRGDGAIKVSPGRGRELRSADKKQLTGLRFWDSGSL